MRDLMTFFIENKIPKLVMLDIISEIGCEYEPDEIEFWIECHNLDLVEEVIATHYLIHLEAFLDWLDDEQCDPCDCK